MRSAKAIKARISDLTLTFNAVKDREAAHPSWLLEIQARLFELSWALGVTEDNPIRSRSRR